LRIISAQSARSIASFFNKNFRSEHFVVNRTRRPFCDIITTIELIPKPWNSKPKLSQKMSQQPVIVENTQ